MERVTSGKEGKYSFYLQKTFSRAHDDPPLAKKKFTMPHAGIVTPSEWLDIAMGVSRGVGIDDFKVNVDEKPDRITYSFYFNDFADCARLSVAFDGLVVNPKGFALSIVLGSESPDEKIEDYYSAFSSFCDSRAIAHQISHTRNDKTREVCVVFDRNVDYYAAKLAWMQGGAVDTHLKLLARQRQEEELTPDMVETLKMEDNRSWPYVKGDVLRNPTLEKQG